MIRYLLIVILALAGASVSAAPPSQPDYITYTVKAGDTLIGLAERGFRREADYAIVQRVNDVRRPRALRIGSTLRIPRRVLRVEPIGAEVIAFRGAAQVNGVTAQVGMEIAEGAVLSTGANAFLAIQLADGSVLTLPSRSRMNVAGLHRVVLTGDEVKRFVLTSGRTETEVAPLKRGSTFEIATPISVAAVRGTRFRVSLGEAEDSSGTGVLEGNVEVATEESAVEVPAGQGVTASEEGVSTPVPLLAKPELLNPDRLQDEELVSFALEPVSGAALYRAQLATDAGFIDAFAEVESQTPELSVADVPNGSFFVRLTAISPAGLEGFPAAYTFERRLNTITAEVGEAEECPAERCLRFRWRAGGEGERRFRFQIARSPDGVPIVDRTNMTGNEIVITDLPGATYYWRVESALIDGEERQAKWMDWQELRVAPASR